MANVIIKCKNCKSEFTARSKKAEFCCKECRNEYHIKNNGVLLEDYVICEICRRAVVSVSGIHMKTYHPEYTVELYRGKFPNSPMSSISTFKKKSNGGKKGGSIMREPEHRKRLSESFKGDKNPMHKSKTDDNFRKSISPFSAEFYKKKDPSLSYEECEKLAKEKQVSVEKISHTQVPYWTQKGFTEEEAKIKISQLQKTFSLDICIEKYGEIDGKKRWTERQEKWKSKVFNDETYIGGGRSKIGEELNLKLLDVLNPYNFNILYGNNEKFIKTKENKAYKYDFTIIDLKLIFEFNGDYWHCNPDVWESSMIHRVKGKTAAEIWKYDNEKILAAKNNGYDVYTIWESEYRKNPEEIFKKCKEIIHEKIKKNT